MLEGPEEKLVEAVKAGFPDFVEDARVIKQKRVSITAKRDGFYELAQILRDRFSFVHPVSAGAVDYPKEEKIRLIYYLVNPTSRFMLTLEVDLPRENPSLPSMTRVWEAMSFHERETGEMFGIHFEGHPNPIPLLLPPDWKGGYPLRKDFKAEGEGQ